LPSRAAFPDFRTTSIACATVLNNFAQVRRSDLLHLAFPDLGAPQQVVEELSAGERSGRVPLCDWRWLRIVQLSEAENRRAQELSRHLDPGEAECLAIAEANDRVIVTDDRAARAYARRLGLKVTGTLGVLDRLVQRGAISLQQANSLLTQMIDCGYRSPVLSMPE
jgi:predicted nucleic acid-binding protein